MNNIKISITEDEALIADHLAACLEELGYSVVAIADNAAETIGNITIHRPDLALIDINLRGEMDGIALANIIREQFGIPFIYITSNSDSNTIERLKATQPAGFILKPFSAAALGPVVEIAMHNNKLQKDQTHELVQIDDALFVKDQHKLVKIVYTDILYAEAQSNYTLIKTKDQKFLISQTMKNIEEKLVPHGFMRIHRSFVVNLKHIDQIHPKAVIVQQKEIPISETYKAELLERVETL